MQKQSVVIDLPGEIYNKYKRRAEQTHRTVEAEIIDVISKAAPGGDKLSAELEELVAQLAVLDDKALTRIAVSKFPKKERVRIEALHFKRQSEGLAEAETLELAALMKRFNRWFVLRNEAQNILMVHGQDVSKFAPTK